MLMDPYRPRPNSVRVSIAMHTDFILHWSLTISPQPPAPACVRVYHNVWHLCIRLNSFSPSMLPLSFSIWNDKRLCIQSKSFSPNCFPLPLCIREDKDCFIILGWQLGSISWRLGGFFFIWVSSPTSCLRLIKTIIITRKFRWIICNNNNIIVHVLYIDRYSIIYII